MRTKSFLFYTILLYCCGIHLVHAQSFKKNDSLPNLEFIQEIKLDSISVVASDSIPSKKPLLLDLIKYTAQDSVKINQKTNKIRLYNKAVLTYQDMELRAGIIVMDYTKNEVYAGRIKDSVGELVQKPQFTQGRDEINPDSIRFNFDTKKALIWNSKTAQSGMNVFSSYTKKENDSLYYIQNAKITTSADAENPDYYIRIRKGKLIPGGKIIASFSNLYIADVPTPIFVPFAYFPAGDKKESGFIFPTFGESNQRGYYLQNMGYYLPVSDYLDIDLTGDYYTNGSYGFRWNTQYKANYKFGGNFSFRYEKLVNGERGFDDYSKSTVYNIRWSHRQDSKASPNSNFSASVNLGSSEYFQQSINQLNTANFLNNNLSSSVSYSKTFPKYPRVNISLTTSLSQNKNTQSANLTLPTFQGNMERIYPFSKRGETKKGILQNINFQVTTLAESRIQTTEEKLFTKAMYEDARSGVTHTIPINTNFKLAKHFSISAGGTLREVWTPNTIRYNNYSEENGVVKDTLSGFAAFRTYNYSLSMGTTIYGTFNFKEGKNLQSIRHTVRPSISYSTQPSFDQYYDTYIIDAEGNTAEYTRFENALYGRPSRGYSNSLGITINNSLEAKVKSKDSLDLEPKKIKLLNNLNISTSYNIAATEFHLAPIRITTGLNFFKDKLTTNIGATFDPYGLDAEFKRVKTFHIKNGGGLLRLTSANINMGYSLDNNTFKREEGEVEEEETEEEDDFNDLERLSGGGRDDDLFGAANDFSNGLSRKPKKNKSISSGLYSTDINWDLKFAYSLTYNNSRGQKDFSNNSLMVSGNIDITPKWKVGASSGYDFKNKGITYTQFRFDRDLDSWNLNFSWVPLGTRTSWYFFIGIKSGLLNDLKYEKRREPDRRF
ncbi:putative LPS assembly protein LptD [Flavobacteriaceae bacterium]|nr:putative LPS assembly protein LptD [Flavobacteriaceae bacterium]